MRIKHKIEGKTSEYNCSLDKISVRQLDLSGTDKHLYRTDINIDDVIQINIFGKAKKIIPTVLYWCGAWDKNLKGYDYMDKSMQFTFLKKEIQAVVKIKEVEYSKNKVELFFSSVTEHSFKISSDNGIIECLLDDSEYIELKNRMEALIDD